MTTNENQVEREIYWYYLRTRDGHPYGTVALYKDLIDGKWRYYRGISICSLEDKFVKLTGRNIAIGRMIKAIKSGSNSLPVYSFKQYQTPTKEIFYDSKYFMQQLEYNYYSEYDCKNLSEFEMRILFRPDEPRV